jgi:hypothetical protein
MRTSRNFLYLVPAGFILAIGVYFGLVFWQMGVPTRESYWCFDLHRRKLATAAAIPGPKLLVVGGSGTLFGIKARQIQEQCGIPTVNLGTHAALGPAYILHLAEKAAKPGDTVLLVLEYELYTQGNDNLTSWAGAIYIDFLMARDPEYFRSLPWRDQVQLSMLVTTKRLKTGLNNKYSPLPEDGRPPFNTYSVYDSSQVDNLGDLCGHFTARRPVPQPALSVSGALARGIPADASGFKEVARFCKWAETNHVRVLATFPNVARKPEYDQPPTARAVERICQFYAGLKVPVVGTAQEAILPTTDFFDTCYHLTEEAAQARTDRLIQRLKPLLDQRP